MDQLLNLRGPASVRLDSPSNVIAERRNDSLELRRVEGSPDFPQVLGFGQHRFRVLRQVLQGEGEVGGKILRVSVQEQERRDARPILLERLSEAHVLLARPPFDGAGLRLEFGLSQRFPRGNGFEQEFGLLLSDSVHAGSRSSSMKPVWMRPTWSTIIIFERSLLPGPSHEYRSVVSHPLLSRFDNPVGVSFQAPRMASPDSIV